MIISSAKIEQFWLDISDMLTYICKLKAQ